MTSLWALQHSHVTEELAKCLLMISTLKVSCFLCQKSKVALKLKNTVSTSHSVNVLKTTIIMRSWWGHVFTVCRVSHKKQCSFFFPSRHQSRPVRWTPPRLRGQQARAVISLSWGLIRWSSSVKCHSASIIRISLTRPSRLHAVNTRWALSQLWARAAAERPFVFFVLGWAAEGGGPVE